MYQYIGIKIQNLLEARGLKQKVLAEKMGIGERHISKKIGKEMKFSPDHIAIAAEFLGVRESFLRDTSRVFNVGDDIPKDALIERKQVSDPPTPLASEIAMLMERQAADIARSEMERMKIEMDAIRESNRQMAQIVNEALGKLAYIADVVREIKDERDGSHDAD